MSGAAPVPAPSPTAAQFAAMGQQLAAVAIALAAPVASGAAVVAVAPAATAPLGAWFPGMPSDPSAGLLLLSDVVVTGAVWIYVNARSALAPADLAKLLAGLPGVPAPLPSLTVPAGGALLLAGGAATPNAAITGALAGFGITLPARPVTGLVDFSTGWGQLTLTTALDGTAGGVLTEVELDLSVPIYPVPVDAAIGLRAQLGLGGGKTVAIAGTVPSGPGRILASATVAAGQQDGLGAAFAQAAGAPNLAQAADLTVSLALDWTGTALVLASLAASVSGTGWDVFPGLAVTAFDADVTVLDPLGSRLLMADMTLTATFGTGASPLSLTGSVHYPSGLMSLALAQPVTLPALLAALGAGEAASALPATLSLATAQLVCDRVSQTVGGELVLAGTWTEGPFTLGNVKVSSVGGRVSVSASFALAYEGGQVPVAVLAGHGPGGWSFSAQVTGGAVPLGSLLDAVAERCGFSLPGFVADLVLDQLGLVWAEGGGMQVAVAGRIAAGPGIAISARIASTPSGLTASGTVLIGRAAFTLGLRAGQLAAAWTQTDGAAIGLGDLAGALGVGLPPLLAGFDLELLGAELLYSPATAAAAAGFVLGLQSKLFGNAVIAAVQVGTPPVWQEVVALDLDRSIGLSDLPLLGPLGLLPALAIDHIAFGAVSADLDQPAKDRVTSLIGAAGLPAPTPGLPQGATAEAGPFFTMTLEAGGASTVFPPAPTTATPAQTALPAATAAQPPATTTAAPSDIHWFNLQKQFGPLAVQKLGVRLTAGAIETLLNASVSTGGLEIGLLGLGISVALADLEHASFRPSFSLTGIDLTYAEGPVTISGGLSGSFDPVNLYGEVIMQAPEFSVSGLAGFSMLGAQPSLFVYAMLNEPIGGPPYFFVTGLAAGFGFNRSLKLPGAAGVAGFPLVAWAMASGAPVPAPGASIADKVDQVLSQLVDGGIVAPLLGSYWLAAGVRFTSFELVQSFALLALRLGDAFEVDLLGQSTLTMPPLSQRADSIVYVSLALEATFKPADGLLAIDGVLTPDSFVFTSDCHLSGGFAYYAWFAGAHEGDFVISVGGYSPNFAVPSHYPAVPRLALNWSIDSNTSVSGSLFYALTSSAVMAGGSLDAVWECGPIRAWFSVEADFLLIYAPLHYHLSASCELGASFKIHLLFVSVSITIHIGVGIEIWGPSFQGEADVDLSIISFTVRFGSSGGGGHRALDFMTEFVPQLLPKGSGTPAILTATVTGGLLASPTGLDAPDWVVDPHLFALSVTSAIPSKNAKAAAPATDDPVVTAAFPPGLTQAVAFGVGPCDIGSDSFQPALTVRVDTDSPGNSFSAAPILKNVPKALWEYRTYDGDGVPQDVDPLNGTTVPNALVGWALTPVPQDPDRSAVVDKRLLTTLAPTPNAFAWSKPVLPPTPPPAPPGTDIAAMVEAGLKQLSTALAAPPARPRLLAAMVAAGFPVTTTVSTPEWTDPQEMALLDPPVFAALGQAVTAPIYLAQFQAAAHA